MSKDYIITIPTYKRYGNIEAMEEVLGTKEILWAFNSEEDREKYNRPDVDYVIGGDLIKNRNALLKAAEEQGKIAVMLDDDLVRVTENTNFNGGEKKVIVSPLEAIEEIVADFKERPQTIAGMSPTDNDFFAGKLTQENKFLIASLMFIKPIGIYFDPDIPLKEDYEITANHIINAGGSLRYNKFMWSFKHYSNEGGCQADGIRSEEREAEAVKYLHNKYPGAFRDNPKRPNEVIMTTGVEEIRNNKNQISLF